MNILSSKEIVKGVLSVLADGWTLGSGLGIVIYNLILRAWNLLYPMELPIVFVRNYQHLSDSDDAAGVWKDLGDSRIHTKNNKIPPYIKGFSIKLLRRRKNLSVAYRAHISFESDTPWFRDGEWLGNRVKVRDPDDNRGVEKIQIKLDGKDKLFYDVNYSIDTLYMGISEAKNGDWAGTQGQTNKINNAIVSINRKPWAELRKNLFKWMTYREVDQDA